jgi:hypothetical protein
MANYGTVDGAREYFDARGVNTDDWDDHAMLADLVVASAYIDGRYRQRLMSGAWVSMFPGTKTGGRAQELEWPRTGATDYTGEEIPDDEIPREVEQATYEAALLNHNDPGSLTPAWVATSQVTREKVGPVEVQYSDASSSGSWPPNYPWFPLIDGIIAPVLVSGFLGPAILTV